jgi:hypothetical protein
VLAPSLRLTQRPTRRLQPPQALSSSSAVTLGGGSWPAKDAVIVLTAAAYGYASYTKSSYLELASISSLLTGLAWLSLFNAVIEALSRSARYSKVCMFPFCLISSQTRCM